MFDIILWALQLQPNNRVAIPSTNGSIKFINHVAYADDLFTTAGSLAGLQQQADIVSLFCLIFGLQIAAAKLRAHLPHPKPIPPNLPET